MLSFDTAPADMDLMAELGEELAEYIDWRSRRQRRPEGLDTATACSLHETIPYWRIPRGVDLANRDLNSQLERAGWHLQIHCGDAPRYYARASLESDWAIDWIGEAWLAKDIDIGIQWLDEREAELPNSGVRLLSSRLFRFSSFIVDAHGGQHVVVSAPRDLQRMLPLFSWLSEDELATRLLDYYGPDYASGGLLSS